MTLKITSTEEAHVKAIIPQNGAIVNKNNELFYANSPVLQKYLFQVKGETTWDPFKTVFQWAIHLPQTSPNPRNFKIRS